ncbi:MAG: hypothetical protein ABFS17_01250 [Chloroflexota bacterium]
MTGTSTTQLTLDRPARYQITVPGKLEKSQLYWDEMTRIVIDWENENQPVSVLTCTLDQAALIGLLRRLYGMGLPLISVVSITEDIE